MKRYGPTSLDGILDSEEALDIADPRYVRMQAEHPNDYLLQRQTHQAPS